jgi:hypothetical protein
MSRQDRTMGTNVDSDPYYISDKQKQYIAEKTGIDDTQIVEVLHGVATYAIAKKKSAAKRMRCVQAARDRWPELFSPARSLTPPICHGCELQFLACAMEISKSLAARVIAANLDFLAESGKTTTEHARRYREWATECGYIPNAMESPPISAVVDTPDGTVTLECVRDPQYGTFEWLVVEADFEIPSYFGQRALLADGFDVSDDGFPHVVVSRSLQEAKSALLSIVDQLGWTIKEIHGWSPEDATLRPGTAHEED